MAVPAHPLLKTGNQLQKVAGGSHIFHFLQHVWLRADQFVGLGQIGCTAVAHHFPGHPARQRIARYAGKGVGAAALQRQLQFGEGRQIPGGGVNLLQPAPHNRLGPVQAGLETVAKGEKFVGDGVQRVIVVGQVLLQEGIRHRFYAVVHTEDRAHIGMDDEPGQGAQDKFGVIGVVVAAFGVGHGHNAVDVGPGVGHPGQAGFQLLDKAARAGGRAQQNNCVAGAHAPATRPRIAPKGPFVGIGGRCFRWLEVSFVQNIGRHEIFKVGGSGQGKADGAPAQGLQHFGVVDVLPRRDFLGGDAERQLPGEQVLAGGDGRDGEAVAFQHSEVERQGVAVVFNNRSCGHFAGDNRDVIAGHGQAGDVIERNRGEGDWLGHRGSLWVGFLQMCDEEIVSQGKAIQGQRFPYPASKNFGFYRRRCL